MLAFDLKQYQKQVSLKTKAFQKALFYNIWKKKQNYLPVPAKKLKKKKKKKCDLNQEPGILCTSQVIQLPRIQTKKVIS